MGGTKTKEEKKKKAHVYSYVLASLSLLDKLFDYYICAGAPDV